MLIGSRALDYHLYGKTDMKSSKDWDVIGTESPFYEESPQKVDLMSPHVLLNEYVLSNFVSGHLFYGMHVCSLEGLAAIKRSHLWRDWDFFKHIAIYHNQLKKYYNPRHDGFVKDRAKLTQEYVKQRNPSLKKSNEEFFDDAVSKVYDHDELHEIVAYGSSPLYTKLKYEGQEGSAWCEKDLWDDLDLSDKLKCVAEEVYVIATERFLVPTDWQEQQRIAYMSALKKVCTTLTSGWFRDFALDNYPEIVLHFNKEKFEDIKEKLKYVRRV